MDYKLEKKSNRLQLRISDSDFDKVKKQAFEANLTVAQYVRQKVVSN